MVESTGVFFPLKMLGARHISLFIEFFKDFFCAILLFSLLCAFVAWLVVGKEINVGLFFLRGEEINRKCSMAIEYGCEIPLSN